MCENFQKLELVQAMPKISPHAKNQPWGSPVSSINSVHINIYIYIYIQSPTKSTCTYQIFTHISSHLSAYHRQYTLNEVSIM